MQRLDAHAAAGLLPWALLRVYVRPSYELAGRLSGHGEQWPRAQGQAGTCELGSSQDQCHPGFDSRARVVAPPSNDRQTSETTMPPLDWKSTHSSESGR